MRAQEYVAPWVTMDLGAEHVVLGVALQGKHNHNEWVTKCPGKKEET